MFYLGISPLVFASTTRFDRSIIYRKLSKFKRPALSLRCNNKDKSWAYFSALYLIEAFDWYLLIYYRGRTTNWVFLPPESCSFSSVGFVNPSHSLLYPKLEDPWSHCLTNHVAIVLVIFCLSVYYGIFSVVSFSSPALHRCPAQAALLALIMLVIKRRFVSSPPSDVVRFPHMSVVGSWTGHVCTFECCLRKSEDFANLWKLLSMFHKSSVPQVFW